MREYLHVNHSRALIMLVQEALVSCAGKLPPSLCCLCVAVEYVDLRIGIALDHLRFYDADEAAPHLQGLDRVVHAFPRRVAEAIPSLRYIGFSRNQPSYNGDTLGADRGASGRREDEYDTAFLAGDVAPWASRKRWDTR